VSFDAPDETDQCRERIVALVHALRGHGFDPQVAETDPVLAVPRPAGSPPLLIRCDRRASDGGRLWFYSPPGTPLEQADDAHMMNVVVAVKTRIGAPPSAGGPDAH
jgi:hypothetical protein